MPPERIQNIVLVGFMGCGKSTIGRKLASMLGYPLVDVDREIEHKTGARIAEIFETRGEPFFRQVEAAVLQEIGARAQPSIIATGGGVIGRRQNRRIVRTLGYVVWLQVDPEILLSRTRRNRDRPLLNTPDAREQIRTLLAQREPFYREVADLELDTTGLDTEEIACGILESARYHFTGNP